VYKVTQSERSDELIAGPNFFSYPKTDDWLVAKIFCSALDLGERSRDRIGLGYMACA